MKTFLYQIAEHYYNEGLDNKCFIFPNRRSITFFKNYLAEIISAKNKKNQEFILPIYDEAQLKPLELPALFTVNDFFYELYTPSLTSREVLLLELYKCYKKLFVKAESFDEFVFWGDIILADFNDIDKYLVEAEQLYTNISDLKKIQDTYSYLSESQRKAIEDFISHFKTRSHIDLGESMRVNDAVKVTERDSETLNVKENFKQIWDIMYPLYDEFNKSLIEKNLAYEGMIYRGIVQKIKDRNLKEVLKKLDQEFEKFVFIGLNAPNECEKFLFKRMQEFSLCEFCWDYYSEQIRDKNNKSSLFMEENLKNFPQAFDIKYEDKIPKIRVISVPSTVGQVKCIPQILQKIADEKLGGDLSKIGDGAIKASDCAIVLPDETLLSNLLNTIPAQISDVNITMGYPMQNSDFYYLMSKIVEMHLNIRVRDNGKVAFYHKYVWEIFSCNLFKKMLDEETETIVKKIKEEAKYYIPIEEFAENDFLRAIFVVIVFGKEQEPGENLIKQIKIIQDYQLNLVSKFASILREKSEDNSYCAMELEFAKKYYNCINLLKTNDLPLQPKTYIRLLKQILSSISVSFQGVAKKGLQIMGPLETRSLDYSNLIIASCNEGMFPRASVSASFIPPMLRKAFSLPTYEYQDSLWAYYMYRILQRADDVYLIYDSKTSGVNVGEESRYIKQLQYHFKLQLERYSLVPEILHPHSEDMIKKTEEDIVAFKSMTLSASALQNYLYCPAKFYYSNIKRLKAENEVLESLNSNDLGNIYHAFMKWAYSESFVQTLELLESVDDTKDNSALDVKEKAKVVELLNQSGNARDLQEVSKNYLYDLLRKKTKIKALIALFISSYLKTDELSGVNLIYEEVVFNYVINTFGLDLKLLEHYGDKQSFKIISLESERTWSFEGYKFRGFIDRLDQFTDEQIRVIDYKTGKILDDDIFITDENAAMVIEKLFGEDNKQRPKIALQLFLYDMFISQRESEIKSKTVEDKIVRDNSEEAAKSMDGKTKANIINSIYPLLKINREFIENIPVNKAGDIPDFAQDNREKNPVLGQSVSPVFLELMQKRLKTLLDTIADPNKDFARCKDLSSCSYCEFKKLCER